MIQSKCSLALLCDFDFALVLLMYQNAMSIASSNNIVLSYIPKLSHCSSQILDPNAPSSLASSIIIHHDDGKEGSGPPPVNSLELLQKQQSNLQTHPRIVH